MDKHYFPWQPDTFKLPWKLVALKFTRNTLYITMATVCLLVKYFVIRHVRICNLSKVDFQERLK